MKLQQTFLIFLVVAVVLVAGCSNTNNTSNNLPAGNIVAEANSDVNDNPEKVTIYFFWGDGCPHCAHEKPFLEELEQKYPEIEVKMFETWKNPENAKLFSDVAKAYGTSAQGVPTTFIDDKYWVGYADYMGEEMENKLKYCLENECINPGDKLR